RGCTDFVLLQDCDLRTESSGRRVQSRTFFPGTSFEIAHLPRLTPHRLLGSLAPVAQRPRTQAERTYLLKNTLQAYPKSAPRLRMIRFRHTSRVFLAVSFPRSRHSEKYFHVRSIPDGNPFPLQAGLRFFRRE